MYEIFSYKKEIKNFLLTMFASINDLIAMMDDYAMAEYSNHITAKNTVADTLVEMKRRI